jgi:23S rRNA pseudouridine2604 synthase
VVTKATTKTASGNSVAKKKTLTLKKPVVDAAKTEPATPKRYSTRAKEAAWRDGRVLFEPAKPKADAASETNQSESRGDIAKGRDRRDASQGKTQRGTANRDASRRNANTTSTSRTSKPRTAASDSSSEGRERRRPRTESSGGNADAARAPRQFQEPRRGGKMRDQAERTERKERAAQVRTESMDAPAPRQPDGRVRVSKLLSEQGLCSRREADSYIARGWVWADGVRVTELGTRVLPTAKLKLDREASAMQESRVTILLHKPVGYVSGQAEDGYQPASVLVAPEHQVADDTKPFAHEFRRGLAPAGRLDIDSTGLLVLTQDGRIAKQLIGEDSTVEKEYLVRVEGELSAEGLTLLNHGLSLDGEALKPAKVKWQNQDQLNFILQEGKKRQIRRMCEAVGLKVVGLKRIRIGRVKLGDLPMGKWRVLREDELF